MTVAEAVKDWGMATNVGNRRLDAVAATYKRDIRTAANMAEQVIVCSEYLRKYVELAKEDRFCEADSDDVRSEVVACLRKYAVGRLSDKQLDDLVYLYL